MIMCPVSQKVFENQGGLDAKCPGCGARVRAKGGRRQPEEPEAYGLAENDASLLYVLMSGACSSSASWA